MEFSRQEYWSGLPFPSPEDLPNPGIKPRSPALQADSLPPEPTGKAQVGDGGLSNCREGCYSGQKNHSSPRGPTLTQLVIRSLWCPQITVKHFLLVHPQLALKVFCLFMSTTYVKAFLSVCPQTQVFAKSHLRSCQQLYPALTPYL